LAGGPTAYAITGNRMSFCSIPRPIGLKVWKSVRLGAWWILCGALASSPLPAADGVEPGTVRPVAAFDLPELQGRFRELDAAFGLAMRQRDFGGAGEALEGLIELAPRDPLFVFRRACLRSLQGNRDLVWADLDRAVELGLRDPRALRGERDLAMLHGDPRFQALLAKAAALSREPVPTWAPPIRVENGIARVEEGNTAWDFRWGVFRSYFEFSEKEGLGKPVASGTGEVEDLLRLWFSEGTAAGLSGDLYENRDSGHSQMDLNAFPQLTQLQYGAAATARGLGNGPQLRMILNAVTLGNSSTAVTGGLYWRSLPRLALTSPGGPALLATQYQANHLHIYPEHRDHDPDFNGDVFPVNTPYLIASQGSSGSDQPFLRAIACTLAAFRPEVKRILTQKGALMPVVQMILRRCCRGEKGPHEYTSGAAHPPVFDAGGLDVAAMARMAHSLEPENLPPVVRLQVLEESQPEIGRESFSVESERLFDTPAAIARVHRTLAYSRRMVISAREGSEDLNGRPLFFRWSVLRGDPGRISIQLLNPEGSVAEVRIGYHERRPVREGSPLFSDRVDIGVFACNGAFDSAPAFVTTYYPATEKRIYDAERRLISVDGTQPETLQAYVDPRIDGRRNWRDEFSYDAAGVRAGWTRFIGGAKQEFAPDGRLIVNRGGKGEILAVKAVIYPLRTGGEEGKEYAEVVPEAAEDTVPYRD